MIITGVDMGSRLRQSVLMYDRNVESVETLSSETDSSMTQAISASVSMNGMTAEDRCADQEPCCFADCPDGETDQNKEEEETVVGEEGVNLLVRAMEPVVRELTDIG